MSSQSNQFLTPVGRLVQGDPMDPQTKDQQGNPLTIKTGPNIGQPTQRFFIALAFPKNDPGFAALRAQMVQVARTAWPQWFDAAGNCTHPKFSWKIMDGDGVDDNGKPNNTKEGFAGHWVVKFSSSFPPKCFYTGRYSPQDQIQDKMAIRRGYYVRVGGTVESNANPQKPGLYVNLNMVELVALGKEIVSGPDAAAVFGAAPAPVLPAGAIALPGQQPPFASPQAAGQVPGFAGAAAGMPQNMTGNAGSAAMLSAAVPGVVSAPAPLPVAPAPAFTAPPTVAAAPVYQMTAKANGATRDQFIASGQGWTDELLRQHGYML